MYEEYEIARCLHLKLLIIQNSSPVIKRNDKNFNKFISFNENYVKKWRRISGQRSKNGDIQKRISSKSIF